MFWNLPVCRDDREQQIPEWAMLIKPFSTAQKQGKAAEMTVKKCPCCSYEMEFPLRKWIFKDLYTESPPPGVRSYFGKMDRVVVCPHCKKKSRFSLEWLSYCFVILAHLYPIIFLGICLKLETWGWGHIIDGKYLIWGLAMWPAVWPILNTILIYRTKLIEGEKKYKDEYDFTSFD